MEGSTQVPEYLSEIPDLSFSEHSNSKNMSTRKQREKVKHAVNQYKASRRWM